jgi:hypothetical protein
MSVWTLPKGWSEESLAARFKMPIEYIKAVNPFAWKTGQGLYIPDEPGMRAAAGRQAATNAKPATPAAAPAAAPAAPAAPAPAAPGRDTSGDTSAQGLLNAALAPYQLGPSAGTWAWQRWLQTGDVNTIMLELPAQQFYIDRYPAMDALAKAGHAITESQYRDLEDSFTASLKAFGLPATFYDQHTDFTKAIAGGVSAKEFDDRLAMHQQVALTDPRGALLRSELVRMGYDGDALGATVAFWIDPDKAQLTIKNQFVAAQTGANSLTTGFGQLSTAEAAKIANQYASATPEAANQATTETLSGLAALKPLSEALVGEVAGTASSRSDLLAAGFDADAEAKKRIARTGENRTAAFRGGGSYATTSGGVSGLGTSGA